MSMRRRHALAPPPRLWDASDEHGAMVHPGLRVRSYRSADEPFVARLAADAFAEFSRRPGPLTLSMLRTGSTLIAELGGRPVGFSVAEFQKDRVAHLVAIAVDYPHRGVGVGSALIAAEQTRARRRGSRALELCTADCNLEAIDLFLRRGFRIEGRVAHFYARGQAACVLRRDLA